MFNLGFRFFGGSKPALTDRQRLEIEASITTYTFIDGVEKRKSAFPMSGLTLAILNAGDRFRAFKESVQDHFFDLQIS